MGFVNSGGFIFPVGINGVGDGYYNPCVPNTISINQQVNVKVRVNVTVRNTVEITVQPAILWLPQTVSIQNSVRNRLNITQELTVGEVDVTNYQTLEEYVQNNSQSVGVTVLANQQNNQQLITNTLKELGKEIVTENETNKELINLQQSIDSIKTLAELLKQVNEIRQTQLLQRAEIELQEAQRIAKLNAENTRNIMKTWEEAKLARAKNSIVRGKVEVQINRC